MKTLQTLALLILGVSMVFAQQHDLPDHSLSSLFRHRRADRHDCVSHFDCLGDGWCSGGTCFGEHYIKDEPLRRCTTYDQCYDWEKCDTVTYTCVLKQPGDSNLREGKEKVQSESLRRFTAFYESRHWEECDTVSFTCRLKHSGESFLREGTVY